MEPMGVKAVINTSTSQTAALALLQSSFQIAIFSQFSFKLFAQVVRSQTVAEEQEASLQDDPTMRRPSCRARVYSLMALTIASSSRTLS